MQRIMLLALAALALGGCVRRPTAETAGPSGTGVAGASDTSLDDATAVSVQIVNRRPGPVEVSLDTGVGRERLFVLSGQGVTAVKIPLRGLAASSRLRLVARHLGTMAIGARASVEVKPGSRVVWTIEPNLAFSSVSVD